MLKNFNISLHRSTPISSKLSSRRKVKISSKRRVTMTTPEESTSPALTQDLGEATAKACLEISCLASKLRTCSKTLSSITNDKPLNLYEMLSLQNTVKHLQNSIDSLRNTLQQQQVKLSPSEKRLLV